MAFIRNVDKLIEGLENKFFTEARAKAALAPELAAEESARQAADSAEAAARQSADNALDVRLDIIEGSGEGSVAKAEQDAKDYADQKVAALVNSAPEVLDTLKELSDALGGDQNFATSVANQIGSVDDKVDQEILDRQSAVSAEQSARESADQALDGRLDVLEQDPTTKSYVDGEVLDLQGQITQEISDRQAAVEAEEDARELADNNLSGRISVLEQDPTTKTYVDQEISSLEGSLDARLDIIEGADNVEGSVAKAEKDAKDYADSLNSAMDSRMDVLEQDPTTKSYVDQEVSAEESRAMSAESALDGRLDILEQDPTTKSYVDGEVLDLQGQISQEILDRQSQDNVLSADIQDEETRALAAEDALDGKIDQEIFDRSAADSLMDGRLDVLEQDPTTKSYVDGIQSALDSRLDVLESDPVTKTYVDGEVSDLQGQVDVEKGRVDAILSAADADKDSFAEIVSLINSIDTSNDNAFASYVLSNDAALAQEISDREADVNAEEQRAMSAESALDARLDIIEGLDSVEGSVAKAEKDAKDYADSLNSAMDSRVDVLEADPVTLSYVDAEDLNLQTQISQEILDRQAGDNALDVRLDVLEADPVTKSYVDTADATKANRELSNLTLPVSVVVDALPLNGGSNSENLNKKGNVFFSNKPFTTSDAATTGQNTFFGSMNSPATLTTAGVGNCAFGSNTLRAATSAAYNVAMGIGAGKAVTSASYNVIIGPVAGVSLATGNDNTIIGMQTFSTPTTSTGVTAIGARAMQNGASSWGVAIGHEALRASTGLANVAVGASALRTLGSNSGCTGIGTDAGRNATGANNTFLGYNCGSSTTSGASNILIGKDVMASSATASNEINIGEVYKATSSQITLNRDVEMVSGQKVKYSTKAAAYTLVAGDYIIAVSDLSAVRVMTLPSAVTMGAGKVFIIKDQSGAASQSNYIQIAPQAGQTIDGQNDYKVVMPYESVMLVSNGSNWFII